MREQIERLYRAMNEGHLEDFDGIFAADYVDHEEGYTGAEPLKQQIAAFRRGFPDLRITVDDCVEAGDRINTRTTVTGTHTGDLMGMPPTGRKVKVSAVDIVRFVGDRATERWGGLNTYSLMVQLGVIPAPIPA